ncbi:MAG TPA: GIY-YIG nuclease family protein [Bacteroidales bacterium]|nr:GIY-YIG nuclease family protein [Bacteroidales bacterium]
MTKDIYIIKNDINNKVYVGQSNNVNQRFREHCKPSSAYVENDLVAKAIQKYGKSHFWVEVLEEKVENYNEREQYWINKNNSIRPNGYNIMTGGEDPPIFSGVNHSESKLTEYILNEIICDLKYSDLSYRQIAKKYNTNTSTVGNINNGRAYVQTGIEYPIRETANKCGKLSNTQVLKIIDTLKFTYLSYEEIAGQYQVEARAISRINKGMFHRMSSESYPIRDYANTNNKSKLSYNDVTKVIDLLNKTNISIRKIAQMFNVEANIIIGIKSGNTKIYRRKGLKYPLRSNN